MLCYSVLAEADNSETPEDSELLMSAGVQIDLLGAHVFV